MALTVFATVILLLHMPTVGLMADAAQEAKVPVSKGLGATSTTPESAL